MDHSDSLSDVPVEGAVRNSANPLPPGMTEEEAEELRTELSKVRPHMFANHTLTYSHNEEKWLLLTNCSHYTFYLDMI